MKKYHFLNPKGVTAHNLLINGDFQCWQRGTSFTFEANQETRYVADLWYVWGYQGQIYKRDVGIAILSEAIICQCLEKSLETGVTYTLVYSIGGTKGYVHLVGGTPYNQGRAIYTVNEGGHDRIKIRANNETINYVALYEGDTVCSHRKEDYAIASTRCQKFLYVGTFYGMPYGHQSGTKYYYQGVTNFPVKMISTPLITFATINVPNVGLLSASKVSLGVGNDYLGKTSLVDLGITIPSSSDYIHFPLIIDFIASCEPL